MRMHTLLFVCALAYTNTALAEERRFLEDTCIVKEVFLEEKMIVAASLDCIREYVVEGDPVKGIVFQYDDGAGKTWPLSLPRETIVGDRLHCPEKYMEVQSRTKLRLLEIRRFLLHCKILPRVEAIAK